MTLVAPEVVQQAQALGLGAELTASVGGRLDHRFSQPLALTARVVNLFDARFVMSGHLARNLSIDMGPSAVLRPATSTSSSRRARDRTLPPELFHCAGLDPLAAAVLVAKSPSGFRAAYAAHAAHIDVVRAPAAHRPTSGTTPIAIFPGHCGPGMRSTPGSQHPSSRIEGQHSSQTSWGVQRGRAGDSRGDSEKEMARRRSGAS